MWTSSESLDVICDNILLKQPVSSSIDSLVSVFMVVESFTLKESRFEEGGFILLGDTLIMLRSALNCEGFGGVSLSISECLNAAMIALDLPIIRSLSADCSELSALVSDISTAQLVLRGRILSSPSHLLEWRPSDTPAVLPKRPSLPLLPVSTSVPQPDWLSRRADTGALAEFYVFNYLVGVYGSDFPLSAWVSSAKRRFFPTDRSRVNDSLGADFEFQDTLGVFAKTKGALLRLEVKGTVRTTFTQFEISRNELRGLTSQNSSEYVIVLVTNASSDFRSPNIYGVIRDLNSLLDLQPIQFMASFDLHAPKHKSTPVWFQALLNGALPSATPPPPPPPPVQEQTPQAPEPPFDPSTVTADFYEDLEGDQSKVVRPGRKRVSPGNPQLTVFESSESESVDRKRAKKEPLLTKSAWYK